MHPYRVSFLLADDPIRAIAVEDRSPLERPIAIIFLVLLPCLWLIRLIVGPKDAHASKGGTMRRKAVALVVASVLIGSGVVMGAVVPASSQQGRTIRLYEREGTGFEKFINVAGQGVAGDYVIETHPLYRRGTRRKVGRDVAQITLIRALGSQGNALFRVALTARLGGGRIEASGFGKLSRLSKGVTFAVTGGTGAYQGATGRLKFRETEGRGYFTFRLNP
jgi:hypothetical protein